jgi:uncharacterized protein YfbU (UPF0304 family)
VKLSDGERLIVVMLAEVMEELNLNREIDPSLVKTLAYGGDEWAIRRKYSGLFPTEAPTPDEVTETTNILWMWGIVEHSISKLTGEDAAEAATWHWTSFGGFDANHDRHYGIAHTMISTLGEFESLKDRPLNSHSQSSLPRYRTMYEKFDRYVHSSRASPLPFEALRDLCA